MSGQFDGSSILTSLLVSKLPQATQTEWESETRGTKTVPPVEDLIEFLERRSESIIQSKIPRSEAKFEHSKKHKAAVHSTQSAPFAAQKAKFTCPLCNGDRHSLYLCTNFKLMPVESRTNHIKTAGLCFNCLGYGHRTKESLHAARSVARAITHFCIRNMDLSLLPARSAANSAVVNALTPQESSEPNACLLMTSQVIIQAPSGRKIVARALLDIGATTSLISNRIVNRLQLPNLHVQSQWLEPREFT